jgi:hypothetical protein
MKHDLVETIRESCPRDKDADDWFDERFEAMKEDNGSLPVDVEEETPVLKDADDMMAEMMEEML